MRTTRFIVYAVKLAPDHVDEGPLEPGIYRSWIIVHDAPDADAAKAVMKRALSEWPRAEHGRYRVGAVPHDALRELASGESFEVDGIESATPE